MKARDLEKKFDKGEDVSKMINWSKARRPNLEAKRVNVDFPIWMVESIDREAQKLGITRQSLIKFWLADHLEHLGKHSS